MIRPLLLAALALTLAVPAVPAAAEDDLVRQLVNACVGCRFPKDLRGRDLHGLRFVGADLSGVDFSRANLNGATFTGSDLEDARFDDADLRNVRFRMEGVRLDGRSIVGADFRTFLRGCTGCDLREMQLTRVERKLRELALRSPMIPLDIERRLRELSLHPPEIPRDIRRRLRELEQRGLREHPPVIPPLPPLPALPALPPVPPVPPELPD
jgi:hypothetical protein